MNLSVARVFITGSADGLGQLAANALIAQGHRVVLHARNEKRGQDALENAPGAEDVVIADLTDQEETKMLASEVNDLGKFDAVIHNAGVYETSAEEIFRVNTLAPYVLTCLIQRPQRLIYLSSGMHLQGRARLDSFKTDVSQITYSDSKLHVLMLCKAVARRWPQVYANALDPGWVPTKMGGKGAPDDLAKGYETQVWLAVSDDAKARVSGRYFFHKKESSHNPQADDILLQDQFLDVCAEITGVSFP
ncbi:MAG TPA: SDR family NAD(P)-dependent oxidoreductase [Pyrinomonadaceae bacterium]|nr:SDR family NAD(P)-dependent oxidoreductase [Pyrinomonadaceae bacterium]